MERKLIDTFKTASGVIKRVYAPNNKNFSSNAIVKNLDYEVTYKLGSGQDTQIGQYLGTTDSKLSILLLCNKVEKVIPIQNIIDCTLVS